MKISASIPSGTPAVRSPAKGGWRGSQFLSSRCASRVLPFKPGGLPCSAKSIVPTKNPSGRTRQSARRASSRRTARWRASGTSRRDATFNSSPTGSFAPFVDLTSAILQLPASIHARQSLTADSIRSSSSRTAWFWTQPLNPISARSNPTSHR